MRTKFIILIVFLLQLLSPVYSRQLPLRFSTWDQASGLSQNTVYSIVKDRQGYIWVGTQDGLNRFDGYQFISYRHHPEINGTISHNWIWNILEDSYGNLWVATYEGLNLYQPERNNFIEVAPESLRGNVMESPQSNFIFQENDTLIWVAVWGKGVYWLDPRSRSFYPNEWFPSFYNNNEFQFIRTIFKDNEGNLFFGTWENGLIKVNGRLAGSETLSPDSMYTVIITDARITSLVQDESGTLWAGTYDEGLYEVNPKSGIFKKYHIHKNQGTLNADDHITALVVEKGHKLWIGTQEKGLITLDIKNNTTQNYSAEPSEKFSLKGNYISTFYMDTNDRIWIGSNGLALYDRYANQFNVQFPGGAKEVMKDPVIWCFESVSDKTVWIGSESGGIYHFDPEAGFIRNISASNSSLAGNNIRAIKRDRFNRIWIGHFNRGIQLYEQERQIFRSIEELRHLQVQDMIITPDDWLWVGTIRGGIIRHHIVNGTTEKIYPQPHDLSDMTNLTIKSIRIDTGGNIWIGTWGKGIYVLDKQTRLIAHLTSNKNNGNSLISNLVNCIYEDGNGNLWAGTHMGISRISKIEPGLIPAADNLSISSANLPDELINQVVYAILGDESGRIWISANHGLSCYSPADGTYNNFGPEDGIQSYEFNSNAALKAPGGLFYFGGVNGFNYFNPEKIVINNYIPSTKITRLFLSGKEVNIDSLHNTGILTLKHNQNSIAFEYTTFDYPVSFRNKFRSRLSGLDDDWQQQGTRRYVNYAGLNPGNYSFSVMGSNKYGNWNSNNESFSFRILPPFWITWWFISFMIIALVSIVYLWHLSRLRKVVEIEKLRIRISGDLHDDIGASLTRISLYSDLLKTEKSQDKKILYLNKIGNLSREVISSMSDIVWSIDSRRDHLTELSERMKGFAVELTANLNMNVVFTMNGMDDNIKIRPLVRQNIYLIFKEALHNAIKHSNGDTVEITLFNHPGHLQLIIKDNGQGLNQDSDKKGNGLYNIRRRAGLINAGLEIKSEQGTSIHLTVKKQRNH